VKILTIDKNHQPLSWVDWTDAVTYKAKDLILWSTGEIVFTAHGGKNRFSGEQSVVKVPSIISVDNDVYIKYRTPVLTNRALFSRDANMCAYCGNLFSDQQLTRDHVVPTSRGGPNTWNNCVTSCKRCNNYKDRFTPQEIGLELIYLPYTPDRNEMMILKNRNILEDQMEFLLRYVSSNSRVAQRFKIVS
jgi:hypothetical protein